MDPEEPAKRARHDLDRLRRVIAIVLGALAILAVLSALLGLWPADPIDACVLSWFGRTSLRTRIVGAFFVYGLFLLAALLLALAVKRLLRR